MGSVPHRIAGAAWRSALAATALAIGSLSAMDEVVADPRALALGGREITARSDEQAPWANPALLVLPALGPEAPATATDPGGWGAGLSFAAMAHQQNDFEGVSRALQNVDVDRLGQGGIQNGEDVSNLFKLVAALADVELSATAMNAGADAGVSTRIGRFALGARMHYEAAAFDINLDLVNLGTGLAGPQVADAINTANAPQDGTVSELTTAQRDSLYAAFGGAGAFDPSTAAGQAVLRVDYGMRQRGLTTQELAAAVGALQQVVSGAGLSLDQNTSSVLIGGFGVLEVPLSTGFRIGPHFAFGGTVAAMVGRVYQRRVSLFEDPETALRSLPDSYKQSYNVGLDLGAVARFAPWSFGIVGRNLNAPSFDGPTVNGEKFPDVRVDPQVTLGIGWVPFRQLLLTGSGDLLETTTALPKYDQQRASFGVEWEAVRFMALRAGILRNVAQGDVPYVLTAGLGFLIGPVRLDLAAAGTTKTDEIAGYNLPRDLSVGLGLSATF